MNSLGNALKNKNPEHYKHLISLDENDGNNYLYQYIIELCLRSIYTHPKAFLEKLDSEPEKVSHELLGQLRLFYEKWEHAELPGRFYNWMCNRGEDADDDESSSFLIFSIVIFTSFNSRHRYSICSFVPLEI